MLAWKATLPEALSVSVRDVQVCLASGALSVQLKVAISCKQQKQQQEKFVNSLANTLHLEERILWRSIRGSSSKLWFLLLLLGCLCLNQRKV
jgi:hypothetical protein